MSKELPFFRFTVSEWLNDDISLESYKTRGVFSDVCAWYWFKDCSVTQVMLNKRFSDAKDTVRLLIDIDVIKADGYDGFINITFLDKQYDQLSDKRENHVKAGRLGGLKRASNAQASLKQRSSYKDNNKEKDKEYVSFITQFNLIRKTKYKGDKKAKQQFGQRLKEGYSVEDMIKALKNAMADDYHKGSNFRYLTPEFITRVDKLEMWMNASGTLVRKLAGT